MSNSIGLYYPYIHFRDEVWLKRAMLYWDKIARIIPPQDFPQDSHFVQELSYRTDFILDERPLMESYEVGTKFLQLLKRYEEPLNMRYGASRFTIFNSNRRFWRNDIDKIPDFVEIYCGKMSPDLKDALVTTGLAFSVNDGEILMMHHQLAGVYMTALADEVAKKGYSPVTDNPMNHYAIMGGTIEHIAQALLPLTRRKKQTLQASAHSQNQAAQVAMFTIEMIMPKNIEAITVDQIIKFRREYGDSAKAFRDDVEEFVQEYALFSTVEKDEIEFQKAIQNAYKMRVEKHLKGMDSYFKKLGWDTVKSLVLVSPSTIVLKGLPNVFSNSEPSLLYVGAVLIGASVIMQAKQKEANKHVGSTAYLLHLKENFSPSDRRIMFSRWSRQFVFGL